MDLGLTCRCGINKLFSFSLEFINLYIFHCLVPPNPFLWSRSKLLTGISRIKANYNYNPPRSCPLRSICRRLPLPRGPSVPFLSLPRETSKGGNHAQPSTPLTLPQVPERINSMQTHGVKEEVAGSIYWRRHPLPTPGFPSLLLICITIFLRSVPPDPPVGGELFTCTVPKTRMEVTSGKTANMRYWLVIAQAEQVYSVVTSIIDPHAACSW